MQLKAQSKIIIEVTKDFLKSVMKIDVANEHLKDSKDCISESIKNLKRVQKHFPDCETKATAIITGLTVLRTDIDNLQLKQVEPT